VVLVKRLDEDNRFCVSCHLHESHYRAMTGVPPSTLAAAHFLAGTAPRTSTPPAGEAEAPAAVAASPKHADHPERCFTCHSGEGVVGWSQVTALSAWDAARWVLGDRHEPKRMRLPIENAACLKCHARDIGGSLSEEETSKYHELASHKSVKMPCVSCHVVHARGERAKLWLDDAVVRERCASCHRHLDES